VRRAIAELMGQQLSAREQARAGAVSELAARRIQEMMNQRYKPRHDDFMVGEPGHRSAAEEIAEGVLISAQREHEERKLPYIGNLLASFAFEPAISRSETDLFLRLANDLSYRQLCVIAILSQKERFPYLRNATIRIGPKFNRPLAAHCRSWAS